jgi:hypothetical protein
MKYTEKIINNVIYLQSRQKFTNKILGKKELK